MSITKCELSSYVLGKTLGKGTFGKVKLATHKITGEPVAIKILEKAKIKDVTDVERVSRELHILKVTQHSSIAQMYEIVETELNIFIVMEYAPLGEFFDFIMDAKIKSESQAHNYFVQIVLGLEYLHKLKVSHRDIKPENMLLDNNNRLKIVDFGLSNMYREKELLLTACGSPCYASPEMIKGEQYDPELTDVWSLGVVLFSMIFAKLPFEDDNTSVLYGKIKSGLYVIDKKISLELKDLLSKLLCVKPQNRLNIQLIKEHPWYKMDKACKCNGVVVGYESVPTDEQILEEMEMLGYNCQQACRYLENNVRNEITTAYYLLMKRKFKRGEPSSYDICNENFSKKLLMPKISKINNLSTLKTRHHSLGLSSPANKETLQVEDYIFSSKKTKKPERETILRKERNCFSQMKSDDYDDLKVKDAIYKTNQPPTFFKNLFKEKYGGTKTKCMRKRESLSNSKKTEKSEKSLLGKRPSICKNIEKEHNISINVYINNAKIETPSRKKSKERSSKEIIKMGQQNNFVNSIKFVNQRLKTEALSRSKASKRYESVNKSDLERKSFQKSENEIEILEGSFWKKKSKNCRTREYTTESRRDTGSRLGRR